MITASLLRPPTAFLHLRSSLRTVRLVDPLGNSRLATLSEWAYRCEWTCPLTGTPTTFVPLGHVTDGQRRPLWVVEGFGQRLDGPMRPVRSVLIREPPDGESRAWWDELYATTPLSCIPQSIVDALMGHTEDPPNV